MYQALYRKWRPQIFDEVSGQEHIVPLLKKEVADNKISHAYLFCGTRGTGKTTLAKILAKAVNCENPNNGNPCNECESCKSITNGSNIDVAEIDAASNNGVDNIREIREETQYTPARSKYKVYIIDEAHMLSTGAFNALLKTLEEPPEHVIFILATTEFAKVPATILSRCQRFDFHRIPNEVIEKRLKQVCDSEGFKEDHEALTLIARLSDGALRDALSILDQCASGGSVTYKRVADITGIGDRGYLKDLAAAVAKESFEDAVQAIAALEGTSKSLETVADELSSYFRDILIVKTCNAWQGLLLSPPAEWDTIRSFSECFSVQHLLSLINILQRENDNIIKSANKKIELEMTLFKLCSVLNKAFVETKPETVTVAKPSKKAPHTDDAPPWDTDSNNEKRVPESPKVETAVKPTMIKDGDPEFWPEVLASLHPSLSASLKRSNVAVKDGKLIIATFSPLTYKTLSENRATISEIQEKVAGISGLKLEIEVKKIDEAGEKSTADDNRKQFLKNAQNFMNK